MIQSTSQLWIVGFFYANRDYIAKVLCINRDNPQSDCKGGCHLKKQIEKDQENQEKTNIDAKAKEVLAYFPTIAPYFQSTITLAWIEINFSNAYFTSFLLEGFIYTFFRPPALIV